MKSKIFKPEKVQTILAGFLLILNGNSILEDFLKTGILLLVSGGLLLLYFFAVSLRIPQDPIIKPLVISLEGIGFLATSYILFKLGKIYLPYGYLLAAVICFFGVFIICRRINREARQRKRSGQAK